MGIADLHFSEDSWRGLLVYGAECWSPVLRHQSKLHRLDRMFGIASRMAFGLEGSTSLDAALVLANLPPASFHIIRRVCRFMFRHHLVGPQIASSLFQSRHYLLPSEIGQAWIRRALRTVNISDPRRLPDLMLDL